MCKNPSDYLPDHEANAGTGVSCDLLLYSQGFTGSPQCTADPSSTEEGALTWKTLTNQVAMLGCCGASKKSACWEDVSAGVCKTASDCTWRIALRSFFFFFLIYFRNLFSLLHTHRFFCFVCFVCFSSFPIPQMTHLIRLIQVEEA